MFNAYDLNIQYQNVNNLCCCFVFTLATMIVVQSTVGKSLVTSLHIASVSTYIYVI